jgi:hypothetical protein
MESTIESRMEKAIQTIYEVRLLCFDILKELKRMKNEDKNVRTQ